MRGRHPHRVVLQPPLPHVGDHLAGGGIEFREDAGAAIEGALEGKPDAVEQSMVCLLARGHLLVEDVPGVGKTTLARALAKAVGGEFRRVQFTSDLLPSDVLGVSVYDQARREFEFKPGPVFAISEKGRFWHASEVEKPWRPARCAARGHTHIRMEDTP